ncbi:tyrosine-type recombinase/integrase [Thiorhodococcus minor]|uniref:Tyrosine-type recombinase/integrase n=1 Tax=Thiorhodococcus minor TaxID=57489 RepID=A0A6M0K5U8_9GAMM|nr:tyrosine-type recombinase/integrase [Thiorhodococcus minor]NEV64681.1 tyrosine-type recombinase/integrase [Thiorhodococcus minor]
MSDASRLSHPLAPSSVSSPSEGAALEADDQDRLARYFSARHASSTLRAYRTDWKTFVGWCEGKGLAALPAPAETIAAFLAAEADAGRKISTIRRRLAAIRLAHRLCGHEAMTSSDLVRGTVRGIARTLGSAPEQKAPALAEQLRAMVDELDCSRPQGLRDRALLTLGFAGAFRRSELVALRVEDLEETPKGLRVHVRQSKTDAEGHGQVVPVVRGDVYCPVRAVQGWLRAAGISEGWVFRRMYRGDRVGEQALTAHSVAAIVKRCALAVGLDPDQYSGHSLRSGFMTSAALSKASLFKLMEVSRHKDPKTVMIYIRRSSEFEDHAGEGLL